MPQKLKITDDRGRVLDATASISSTVSETIVTLESRSGNARNRQYREGFLAILERFSRDNSSLAAAYLSSRNSIRLAKSDVDRLIDPHPYRYPIHLDAVADLRQLRDTLRANSSNMFSKRASSSPGNYDRRAALHFHQSQAKGPAAQVEKTPSTKTDQPSTNTATIEKWVKRLTRPQQRRFAAAVATRDGLACAITGCTVAETLVAAHILPYAKYKKLRADPENGIILRSDIHSLFDAKLIRVNPTSLVVQIDRSLISTDYGSFDGKFAETKASRAHLRRRFSQFQKTSKT